MPKIGLYFFQEMVLSCPGHSRDVAWTQRIELNELRSRLAGFTETGSFLENRVHPSLVM